MPRSRSEPSSQIETSESSKIALWRPPARADRRWRALGLAFSATGISLALFLLTLFLPFTFPEVKVVIFGPAELAESVKANAGAIDLELIRAAANCQLVSSWCAKFDARADLAHTVLGLDSQNLSAVSRAFERILTPRSALVFYASGTLQYSPQGSILCDSAQDARIGRGVSIQRLLESLRQARCERVLAIVDALPASDLGLGKEHHELLLAQCRDDLQRELAAYTTKSITIMLGTPSFATTVVESRAVSTLPQNQVSQNSPKAACQKSSLASSLANVINQLAETRYSPNNNTIDLELVKDTIVRTFPGSVHLVSSPVPPNERSTTRLRNVRQMFVQYSPSLPRRGAIVNANESSPSRASTSDVSKSEMKTDTNGLMPMDQPSTEEFIRQASAPELLDYCYRLRDRWQGGSLLSNSSQPPLVRPERSILELAALSSIDANLEQARELVRLVGAERSRQHLRGLASNMTRVDRMEELPSTAPDWASQLAQSRRSILSVDLDLDSLVLVTQLRSQFGLVSSGDHAELAKDASSPDQLLAQILRLSEDNASPEDAQAWLKAQQSAKPIWREVDWVAQSLAFPEIPWRTRQQFLLCQLLAAQVHSQPSTSQQSEVISEADSAKLAADRLIDDLCDKNWNENADRLFGTANQLYTSELQRLQLVRQYRELRNQILFNLRDWSLVLRPAESLNPLDDPICRCLNQLAQAQSVVREYRSSIGELRSALEKLRAVVQPWRESIDSVATNGDINSLFTINAAELLHSRLLKREQREQLAQTFRVDAESGGAPSSEQNFHNRLWMRIVRQRELLRLTRIYNQQLELGVDDQRLNSAIANCLAKFDSQYSNGELSQQLQQIEDQVQSFVAELVTSAVKHECALHDLEYLGALHVAIYGNCEPLAQHLRTAAITALGKMCHQQHSRIERWLANSSKAEELSLRNQAQQFSRLGQFAGQELELPENMLTINVSDSASLTDLSPTVIPIQVRNNSDQDKLVTFGVHTDAKSCDCRWHAALVDGDARFAKRISAGGVAEAHLSIAARVDSPGVQSVIVQVGTEQEQRRRVIRLQSTPPPFIRLRLANAFETEPSSAEIAALSPAMLAPNRPNPLHVYWENLQEVEQNCSVRILAASNTSSGVPHGSLNATIAARWLASQVHSELAKFPNAILLAPHQTQLWQTPPLALAPGAPESNFGALVFEITNDLTKQVQFQRWIPQIQRPTRYVVCRARWESAQQCLVLSAKLDTQAVPIADLVNITATVVQLGREQTIAKAELDLHTGKPEGKIQLPLVESRLPWQLRVSVDGWPNTYIYSAPDDPLDCELKIDRQYADIRVRAVTDQSGKTIHATAGPAVNAELEVIASDGTFDPSTDRIEVGIDLNQDRLLAAEPTETIRKALDVEAIWSGINEAGQLLIRTRVALPRVKLPIARDLNMRTSILAGLYRGSQIQWSPSAGIVVDHQPPRLRSAYVAGGEISSLGVPVPVRIEVLDDELSEIASVEGTWSPSGQLEMAAPPIAQGSRMDDGKWRLGLPTDGLSSGRILALFRATDQAGNTSKIFPLFVETGTAEEIAAIANSKTTTVSGKVSFMRAPTTGIKVTLNPDSEVSDVSQAASRHTDKTKLVSRRPARVTVTNDRGEFRFDDVTSGKYTITVRGIARGTTFVRSVAAEIMASQPQTPVIVRLEQPPTASSQ